MSWLIGTYARNGKPAALVEHLPGPASYQRHTDKISLCAGGRGLAYQQGKTAGGEDYIVLGYPLLLEGNKYRIPTERDWPEILQDESKISQLDGHWLILASDGEKLRAYTDPLGKRSFFYSETDAGIFFTSSLEILKKVLRPEVDFFQAGAYWHAMFPPSNDRYAPGQNSIYKGVRLLPGGSILHVSAGKISVHSKLFAPDPQKRDIYSLIASFALAPFQQTEKVAVGLSGGMDIRPLLAIYLKAGKKPAAINYGDAGTQDWQAAKNIAAAYGLPFTHISYEEAEGEAPWAQAVDFMRRWGITASPVNAPYLGYYGRVAELADCYVSGYFGELYRFRFFVAHLLSLFKGKTDGFQLLASYLYGQPDRIFQPELHKMLHTGFTAALREAVDAMPALGSMPNPLWCNLFLARYCPFTLSRPALSELDSLLLDHMPWLQSGVCGQHWHYGLAFQLGEGIHRRLIRRNQPSLEKFPLTALDVSAPYFYRQYMLKTKMWLHYRRTPLTRESRLERFLRLNKEPILDLFHSRGVQENPTYDLPLIEAALQSFYKGDPASRNTLHNWLAWELGK